MAISVEPVYEDDEYGPGPMTAVEFVFQIVPVDNDGKAIDGVDAEEQRVEVDVETFRTFMGNVRSGVYDQMLPPTPA